MKNDSWKKFWLNVTYGLHMLELELSFYDEKFVHTSHVGFSL